MTKTAAAPSEQAPTRILIASVSGAGLGFVGASVVNVALPTFQLELGADAADLQWIVSAYNLAIASLLLGAGAFSDRFGHQRTFLAGLACYAAASAVCGAAPNADVMIGARIVQGFAAALLVPSSLGLVNTAYPAETRGHAIGLWSSFSAVGAGLGPLIAGALIETASWRYLFWINVPIALTAWWLLRTSPPIAAPPHPEHPFDWRGAAYSVLSLGVFTYAAIEAPVRGIVHPVVLTGFALAALGASAFVLRQARSPAPLLPLSLFRSPDFSAVNIVTFLAYCTIGGGFYVMMLTWIQIQGYSPLAAGAITLPFMLFTGGLAHSVGHLVRRFGPRWPLTGGLTLLGAGFLSWTLPQIGTSFWTGYLPGVLATALGIALIVGPVTTVVVGAVDLRDSGIASGVNSAVARSAILLSVAVLGAVHFGVFERTASAAIGAMALDPAIADGMERELINMAAAAIPAGTGPETTAALERVIDESFLRGARVVTAVSGALALGGAVIAAAFVGRRGSGSA